VQHLRAKIESDVSRAARRLPWSLRRDVVDPHDLAPLLGFSGDENSELLGIERHRPWRFSDAGRQKRVARKPAQRTNGCIAPMSRMVRFRHTAIAICSTRLEIFGMLAMEILPGRKRRTSAGSNPSLFGTAIPIDAPSGRSPNFDPGRDRLSERL
jgi:hypothetical protein